VPADPLGPQVGDPLVDRRVDDPMIRLVSFPASAVRTARASTRGGIVV
jgi:hypothetical protein